MGRRHVAVIIAANLIGAGCGPSASSATACDPHAYRAVAAAHADRTEITLCGTVVAAGRERRSRSGEHRVIDVRTADGAIVAIDANLDMLGELPVRVGEPAVVRGEYYFDRPGHEGIHWTHRTIHGTHPAGFIVLDGVTFR